MGQMTLFILVSIWAWPFTVWYWDHFQMRTSQWCEKDIFGFFFRGLQAAYRLLILDALLPATATKRLDQPILIVTREFFCLLPTTTMKKLDHLILFVWMEKNLLLGKIFSNVRDQSSCGFGWAFVCQCLKSLDTVAAA